MKRIAIAHPEQGTPMDLMLRNAAVLDVDRSTRETGLDVHVAGGSSAALR
jgi:hypothetical protein